jgi:tRNA dimethylallyltransferase
VIRALEVFRLAGSPMSSLEKQARPFHMPAVMVGVTRSRPDLYRRIDRRVDLMMEAGFLDEVKDLIERGFGRSSVVRDSVGYREAILHLEGRMPLEAAVGLMKKTTRNFAKRQLTWFKREQDITWIDVTETEDYATAVSEVSAAYTSQAGERQAGGINDAEGHS